MLSSHKFAKGMQEGEDPRSIETLDTFCNIKVLILYWWRAMVLDDITNIRVPLKLHVNTEGILRLQSVANTLPPVLDFYLLFLLAMS